MLLSPCATPERPTLPAVCRQAEILVAAAGQSGLVDAGFLAPGQVVLDVGDQRGPGGRTPGRCGLPGRHPDRGGCYTRARRGWAVTTAVLAKHVVEAAERTLSCGP